MCLALFFSHQLQQLYFPVRGFQLILCWDLKGGQKNHNVDFQLFFLPEVQSKHVPVGTDQHLHFTDASTSTTMSIIGLQISG